MGDLEKECILWGMSEFLWEKKIASYVTDPNVREDTGELCAGG